MNYDFRAQEHKEFGSMGLAPTFVPQGEPFSGMTAAHDIMEHFSGYELNSDSEALALGASLYIRGKSGYFQNSIFPKCPGYVLASDVANLFIESYRWGEITDPGRTCRLDDDEAEFWIEKAIRLAKRELRNDHEQRVDDEWCTWVRGWLRKGFRKARKRYSLDAYTLGYTFGRMSKELDKALKNAEPGEIVRAYFVRKTCEFRVYNIPWYDPEHPDYEPDLWEDEW